MTAYYNEHDKHAAEWLRNLVAGGHIAPGVVDERSIEDVRPEELVGYTQCHFFAGIGGWSYALRLAGWPDDKPVWTGSCPCQPFSAAGKGAGFADERHLWPAFHWLIKQCRPQHVFGEQVAGATAWLDLVHADMEAENYTFRSVVLGAHSVGAPHQRQRLFWVANAQARGQRGHGSASREGGHAALSDTTGTVADPDGRHTSTEREPRCGQQRLIEEDGCAGGLADSDSQRLDGQQVHVLEGRSRAADTEAAGGGGVDALAHTPEPRSQGRDEPRQRADAQRQTFERGSPRGAWDAGEWVVCNDGKARLIEPGIFPLAHGVSGRVGLLRGYGNAIVPQVAAAFIEAST